MKVLHVNTVDLEGGAARAAYRIHRGLLDNGIESEMVVGRKSGDDWTVVLLGNGSRIERLLLAIRFRLDKLLLSVYRAQSDICWSANVVANNKLVNYINESDCDVVNLHWVNQEFLSISDIEKIKKPVVWTMHDMWVFTGGCHVTGRCEGYKETCSICPKLKTEGKTIFSKYVFGKKLEVFGRTNICFVAPSRWLAMCASESTLLKDKEIRIIPNGIDTAMYKYINRKYARAVFNIGEEENIILYGAVNATGDYNKGYDLLKEAITHLPDKMPNVKFTIMVFGAGEPKIPEDIPYKIIYLGRLQDDASLVCLYNCADVVVVPSRQESFGQTALEALACGVPVVAFASTGLLDIIEHKKNGYLATPYDAGALSDGITHCIKKKGFYRNDCEKKAKGYFDIKLVARKYSAVYEHVIKDVKV